MMKYIYLLLFFTCGIICSAQTSNVITVSADKPGSTIQPTMWGIFFEDINFAADGGIYAELVKNRSFEFARPLMGWKILKPDTTSGVLIINQGTTNPANPRYARITVGPGEPSFGLSNGGFRGMGVKNGMKYNFSVFTRQSQNSQLKMRIELVSSKGEVVGTTNLAPEAKEWKKYTAELTATATDPKARLNIWFGKRIFRYRHDFIIPE